MISRRDVLRVAAAAALAVVLPAPFSASAAAQPRGNYRPEDTDVVEKIGYGNASEHFEILYPDGSRKAMTESRLRELQGLGINMDKLWRWKRQAEYGDVITLWPVGYRPTLADLQTLSRLPLYHIERSDWAANS
jgi:hypothetical protein